MTRLRSYDTLVLLTSEHWYSLAEALLDLQIVYINLGPTPVEEDRRVDPLQFRRVLMQVLDIGKEREEIETRCGD